MDIGEEGDFRYIDSVFMGWWSFTLSLLFYYSTLLLEIEKIFDYTKRYKGRVIGIKGLEIFL